MKTGKFKTGKIAPMNVDLSSIDFVVDTAGSWDGNFPDLGPGDYLVEIRAWDREEPEVVLVSRRYTKARDEKDAASLALSAFAERHSYETDDEGELVPVTVEGTTGIPVWVERVYKLTMNPLGERR